MESKMKTRIKNAMNAAGQKKFSVRVFNGMNATYYTVSWIDGISEDTFENKVKKVAEVPGEVIQKSHRFSLEADVRLKAAGGYTSTGQYNQAVKLFFTAG